MVTVGKIVLLFYLALQGISQHLSLYIGQTAKFSFHSDVQCGQLQCMAGDFQANVGVSVSISTITIGSITCR